MVPWLFALVTVTAAPPPPAVEAPLGRVEPASDLAILRLEGCPGGVRVAAEHSSDGQFRCEGHHLDLPAGSHLVRLMRPGQRDVTATVFVIAGRTVVIDAEPAPAQDDTLARSWAVTGVAVGVSLILTSILVVSLDGDESAEMRLALPLAIGLGSGMLVGSAHAVRHLDATADAPYPGTFSIR